MKKNERTLAYNQALLVNIDELEQIGGGSGNWTTQYTTKQSVDQYGNWDVGADVRWD